MEWPMAVAFTKYWLLSITEHHPSRDIIRIGMLREAILHSFQAEVSLVVLSRPTPVKKKIAPSIAYTAIILVLEEPLPELTKFMAAAINPIIPKIVSIIPNIFFSML